MGGWVFSSTSHPFSRLALRYTFLCSKLQNFCLFGLTVHQVHKPAFSNSSMVRHCSNTIAKTTYLLSLMLLLTRIMMFLYSSSQSPTTDHSYHLLSLHQYPVAKYGANHTTGRWVSIRKIKITTHSRALNTAYQSCCVSLVNMLFFTLHHNFFKFSPLSSKLQCTIPQHYPFSKNKKQTFFFPRRNRLLSP